MNRPWTTEVRAPGKLYIAGEYAVVEPGFPAVLIAVDRYVTVRVRDAVDTGRITSDLNAGSQLEWYRRGPVGDEADTEPSFIMKSKDEKGDKPERGERRRRDDEEAANSNNEEAGDDAASAE